MMPLWFTVAVIHGDAAHPGFAQLKQAASLSPPFFPFQYNVSSHLDVVPETYSITEGFARFTLITFHSHLEIAFLRL